MLSLMMRTAQEMTRALMAARKETGISSLMIWMTQEIAKALLMLLHVKTGNEYQFSNSRNEMQ